jgi:hypothetical protein
VRLHGAPGHLELSGNLRIVTTLKQQFGNLLFARTQPNGAFVHSGFPLVQLIQARLGQLVMEAARTGAPAAESGTSYTPDFGFSQNS